MLRSKAKREQLQAQTAAWIDRNDYVPILGCLAEPFQVPRSTVWRRLSDL